MRRLLITHSLDDLQDEPVGGLLIPVLRGLIQTHEHDAPYLEEISVRWIPKKELGQREILSALTDPLSDKCSEKGIAFNVTVCVGK